MSSKHNTVLFEGNVGRDSSAKQLSGGKTLTTFSLAVNQGKDKETIWLNVKHFNENGALEFQKGQKVSVAGRLFFEKFQDKEGYQRQSWGVIADRIEVVEKNQPYNTGKPDLTDEEVF